MNDLLGLVKQCLRDSQRWFPKTADDPLHHALSLCGETGEVANLMKKVHRGSLSLDDARERLGEEAVDALIYLCCLFATLGVDPVEIYKEKRAANELRFGNGSQLAEGRVSGTGVIAAVWDRADPRDTPPLDPRDYFRGRAA
jgi:NTP pyrophosphatase (non-canonical NTP hydrolase)